MKVKLQLFLASFSLTCVEALGQVMGNAQYNAPRSMGNSGYGEEKPITPFHHFPMDLPPAMADGIVTLSISGLMNALPESCAATFGIVQGGETAEATERAM